MEHVRALIAVDSDRAGCILVTLMDKFGVYLAFHGGARGSLYHATPPLNTFDNAGFWTSILFKVGLWNGSCSVWDARLSNTASSAKLSIGAGEVFFIHFIRALSLFPDGDPATYPLLALALALIT
ncbi:LOW QUALITY PROTEIN: hypothetical protein PHMEG_00017917 [Phytophthora megakarya]|uniref:Uncharacterized protein n=1 Tax=Phytophthora megakarya TaxID=4795 RepID=A0A225VXU5_9STRA|nr:LOW QUALITY PROTEIN: hypothetical protein PHMEG_00017917 [Phytophthora megakarya]